MDIGALTVFLYCFREREELLQIFEHVSGQRMMGSYFRVGGVSMEPPVDFYERVQNLLNIMPSKIDEYENLLTGNPIWISRTKGVGHLSAEDAIALGVTGPPLRASGVDWDLRRDMPYSGYENFQFKVPISNDCDVWARYVIRMDEMRESVKIMPAGARGHARGPAHCGRTEGRSAGSRKMKTQMESLIYHFKIVTEGFAVPAGEVYQAIESPRGEMGYYAFQDGTAKPYRVHMRNPSFATLQAVDRCATDVCSLTWLQSSGRSTSCSVRSTGECSTSVDDSQADVAARTGCFWYVLHLAHTAATRRGHMVSRRNTPGGAGSRANIRSLSANSISPADRSVDNIDDTPPGTAAGKANFTSGLIASDLQRPRALWHRKLRRRHLPQRFLTRIRLTRSG